MLPLTRVELLRAKWRGHCCASQQRHLAGGAWGLGVLSGGLSPVAVCWPRSRSRPPVVFDEPRLWLSVSNRLDAGSELPHGAGALLFFAAPWLAWYVASTRSIISMVSQASSWWGSIQSAHGLPSPTRGTGQEQGSPSDRSLLQSGGLSGRRCLCFRRVDPLACGPATPGTGSGGEHRIDCATGWRAARRQPPCERDTAADAAPLANRS